MRELLLFLLVFVPLFSFGQKQVTWDFPVKPGSTEWRNANSYQERLNLYNIPDKILDSISTRELIRTCLNYPELRLIFTRNDFQSGYSHIFKEFNGFKELESRNDAGKELLNAYKSYNPGYFDKNSTNLEIGYHIIEFTYIELLIAQPNILKNLSETEVNELRIECIRKFKEKKELQEYFGILGLSTTALILARNHEIQLSVAIPEFDDEKYQQFIRNAIVYDPSILDEIVNKCEILDSVE